MYCPSCGTQNDDAHRFCKKCGTPLPKRPVQQHAASPNPVPSYHKQAAPPANPIASFASAGGITSMLGGILIIVGWFMPWSKDFLISTNGLQLTISGISAFLLGLGTLDDSGMAILLVLYGLVAALAYGSIPILGGLNIKNGFEIFEDRNYSRSRALLQIALTKLRSRSRNGFILVAVIFVLPLILSSLVQAILPGLFLLGQILGKLLQSEYGMGIFVSAVGFALVYGGTRYASSQVDRIERDNASVTMADTNSLPKVEASASLSETEKEIVKGFVESLDDTEIAKRLNIQAATLNVMLLDLFHRFKVQNKEELIAHLEQRRLIS